ncbi:hypothetical protein ACJ41O_008949 [Fusarium nematophilum]
MPELKAYLGVAYLWQYVPSLPGSIAFAVIFGIITTAHGWKMYKTRMWFCLPFAIGGICEELGYICRAMAWDSTDSLPLYIMQATFILIPPSFFAASLYMVYSRIVRAVQGDTCSLISPRWTTRFFVIGDIVTLNIQSTGAGLVANPEHAHVGNPIVVTGLIFQVLLFIVFVMCCIVFHRRFRAHLAENGGTTNIPWRSCLHMLYWTSVAILVRNVFRVVEYIMGEDGYLLRREWPMFAFDSVLMVLVMGAFYVWYPSELVPGKGRQQDERGSMVELASRGANSAEHVRPFKDRETAA